MLTPVEERAYGERKTKLWTWNCQYSFLHTAVLTRTGEKKQTLKSLTISHKYETFCTHTDCWSCVLPDGSEVCALASGCCAIRTGSCFVLPAFHTASSHPAAGQKYQLQDLEGEDTNPFRFIACSFSFCSSVFLTAQIRFVQRWDPITTIQRQFYYHGLPRKFPYKVLTVTCSCAAEGLPSLVSLQPSTLRVHLVKKGVSYLTITLVLISELWCWAKKKRSFAFEPCRQQKRQEDVVTDVG